MSDDNILYMTDARLSFPNLVTPQVRKNPDGTEKSSHNCEFIMPESHPFWQNFMGWYARAAAEKWKEHANTVMGIIQADRKLRCFGPGAEKVNQRTFQPYDGYAGNWFLTVGNKHRPQIIGADGKAIDGANTMAYEALARKLYGGCRVNAAVKPWLQENKHGRGIRCDLIAIQFLRDDAPFGEGTPDASGMFGAVASAPAAAGASMPPGMPPFMAPPAAPQMPAPPFGGAPTLPPFMQR